jgi:hypothetical protein
MGNIIYIRKRISFATELTDQTTFTTAFMAKKDFKGGISTLIKRTEDQQADNAGKNGEPEISNFAPPQQISALPW